LRLGSFSRCTRPITAQRVNLLPFANSSAISEAL
jgi:hypothetical protein